MGDEDDFMGGEPVADQDLEVGRRIGFLPAVAIKILKWAALALAAVIFVVTVVVITVSIMGRGTNEAVYPVNSPQYQGKQPVLSWYTNIPEIRGRTADTNPTTFIVKVDLGYTLNAKQVQTELVARTPLLTDMVRSFFSSKTAVELTNPNNENQLKEALRIEINNVMTSGKIKSIAFESFNVVPL
jgi:flagellar FliL protein